MRELSLLKSPTEALAVLDAIEEKRKKSAFVRYWLPATEAQWQAVKLLNSPGVKVAIIRGGNRSGKSECGAAIASAFLLGKKYFEGEPAWEWVKDLPIPIQPRNIWVVGLDFPVLKNVLWHEKLRFGKSHPAFIPDVDGLAIKKINDSDFQIFAADGSVLTGKSADSGREKFQGASVDLA